MLAGHVEAELLGDFDVVAQGFIGRRGVKAIGPEALVERADLEQRFAVEQDPLPAFRIAGQPDLPQAKVAFDPVRDLALVRQGDFRSYRCGSCGVQRLAAGSWIANSAPGLPVVRATSFLPSRTITSTESASAVPAPHGGQPQGRGIRYRA